MKTRIRTYSRKSIKEKNSDSDISRSIKIQQDSFSEEEKSDFDYVDDGKSASMKDNEIRYKLTEDYEFIVNFNLKKRPDFFKMLKDAEIDLFDVLLLYKWDRFARNTLLFVCVYDFLKKNKISVKSIKDSNDSIMRLFSAFLNEKFSRDLSKTINGVRDYKFKLGIYSGGARKKGYKWKKIKIDNTEYKTLIPFEKEINIIKECFNNDNYKEVCSKHKISPKMYYSIRRDDFYIGIITNKNEKKKGIHETFITKEQFTRVNPNTYYSIRKDDFYIGIITNKNEKKKGIHETFITKEQFRRVNNGIN